MYNTVQVSNACLKHGMSKRQCCSVCIRDEMISQEKERVIMPSLRKSENPSTYIVQDRKNQKELARLAIQDRLLTMVMGGVLPEQPDPTIFRHVLDVGCGTGGWAIEAAQAYPTMSLVGIDISQRMIKYAHTQAEAHQVHDRIKFYVMDALGPLDFPAASFDLVNLRLGVSFMRIWDWTKTLGELLRVTHPRGVIRITDSDVIFQSNSASLVQLCKMVQCAFFRAGHLFEDKSTGLTSRLTDLLNQCGCQQIQMKANPVDYKARTPEGEAFCENLKIAFNTLRPFIQKWGCIPKDYDTIYRQAFEELYQPDAFIIVNMLTAWGCKP